MAAGANFPAKFVKIRKKYKKTNKSITIVFYDLLDAF